MIRSNANKRCALCLFHKCSNQRRPANAMRTQQYNAIFYNRSANVVWLIIVNHPKHKKKINMA